MKVSHQAMVVDSGDQSSVVVDSTGPLEMSVCGAGCLELCQRGDESSSMDIDSCRTSDATSPRWLRGSPPSLKGRRPLTSASCTGRLGTTPLCRAFPLENPPRKFRGHRQVKSLPIYIRLGARRPVIRTPCQALCRAPAKQQLACCGRMSDARPCTGEGGPWKDIPDDIFKRVLDCMPASYMRVVRRVCRGWADAGARFITRLKPEQLDGARLASRFPVLQALHLSHCNSAMLSQTQNALSLRCILSDAQLEQQLPGLREMRSLRLLSLQGCGSLTGNPHGAFRHLPSLSQITTLDISNCENMREAALEAIVQLPKLDSLFMTGCPAMTDAALAMLVMAKPGLRKLEFGGSAAITDAGLARLSELSGLERLSMTRCPSISDDGLMHLLGLPKLRTVIISCCANITEEGVRTVAAHQTLKVVTAAVLPVRRMCTWQPSAYPTLDMRMVEY